MTHRPDPNSGAPSPSALTRLAADLELPERTDEVLARLFEVYREVDDAAGRGADGLGLPCRPGCDACCHEAVFVSAPEFLAVAEYLLCHRSLDERRSIVDEMNQIAAAYEDELALLEFLSPGHERDEVAQRVRFRCPLLRRDGRCTVYPVRELNARTFGVSRDEARDEPYGCALTHERLRVLPAEATGALVGARAARQRLRDHVPGAGPVRVYPWWFARFGHWLVDG